MNKITWFLSLMTLSIVITFFVNAYSNSLIGLAPPGMTNPNAMEINNLADVWNALMGFFNTYINIAFFNVPGLPPLFNILFLISNAGMIYAIIK